MSAAMSMPWARQQQKLQFSTDSSIVPCCYCTQEAARLMAAGDYEAALPVAMESVALGEQLFKPQPALQLFPLYLLAAQVRAAEHAQQCNNV